VGEFAVAALRREQDADLAAFGVRFDGYYLESSLYTDGLVDATVAALAARGKPFIEEIAKGLGAREVRYDEDVVKVSIVGLGMRSHAGIAAKMFRILANEGINIQAISTSEIKVSCLIAAKYTELAVRSLHAGFIET